VIKEIFSAQQVWEKGMERFTDISRHIERAVRSSMDGSGAPYIQEMLQKEADEFFTTQKDDIATAHPLESRFRLSMAQCVKLGSFLTAEDLPSKIAVAAAETAKYCRWLPKQRQNEQRC